MCMKSYSQFVFILLLIGINTLFFFGIKQLIFKLFHVTINYVFSRIESEDLLYYFYFFKF